MTDLMRAFQDAVIDQAKVTRRDAAQRLYLAAQALADALRAFGQDPTDVVAYRLLGSCCNSIQSRFQIGNINDLDFLYTCPVCEESYYELAGSVVCSCEK